MRGAEYEPRRLGHGAKARERATDLAETIKELQVAGCESLRAIAAGLQARGIPAARGGRWEARPSGGRSRRARSSRQCR